VIKAIAFDLDGTLVDSTEAIVGSFFHTFEVLGEAPPPRKAIVDSIGRLLEDQFRLFTQRDPAECTRIYRAHYGTTACDQTSPLPGARECLERLRAGGFRLGFATSKRRHYAEMILDHLKLLDFFETRLGPDDVDNAKPHPEAVLKSAEGLGVACDELFFVGDTEFDVLAARAANVRCLCVTTGYDTREKLESLEPEAVFDTLDELTDYIFTHREE